VGRLQAGARNVSILQNYQTGSGATQPPTPPVPKSFSPEVKRSRHETEHSRQTSAELNEWSYTPTSPYVSMAYTKTTSPFTKYNKKNSNSEHYMRHRIKKAVLLLTVFGIC
jgi:hypothetical protein